MNVSPMTRARRAVVEILQADPQLVVTNVFRDDQFIATKIVCYPYVTQVDYPESLENGMRTGYMRASFEILANAVADNDPSGKGVASEKAGELVSRVMHRLETYDVDTLAVGNDGRYKTRILSVTIDGNVGDFDEGNRVRIGLAGTVVAHIESL